jgi:hypothetical protein
MYQEIGPSNILHRAVSRKINHRHYNFPPFFSLLSHHIVNCVCFQYSNFYQDEKLIYSDSKFLLQIIHLSSAHLSFAEAILA